MTGMGDVDLSLPTKSSMQSFMSCIKVSAGTKVHFKMSDPTSHYPVGGTTDGMSVKVDGSTFIKCCSNDSLPVYQGCCGSPFNCCTSEEIFTFSQAGIYPWYDAKNFALIHGMIIVQ